MYIHLGSDEMVPADQVIAILNIENAVSPSVKEIIEIAAAENKIHAICDRERAKTLVVTNDKCYFSPISSVTLMRRSRNLFREG